MKSLFVSKTFWANAVAMVAMIVSMSGHGLPPEIASSEAQAQVVGVIMAIVNIVLRTITSEPVSITK